MAYVGIFMALHLVVLVDVNVDVDVKSPGLFQEDCGDQIASNPNEVTTCDTTRHLECVNWRCECIRDYVYDGDCGCRWGLAGYGAKCFRDSQTRWTTCDFRKNLTCDSVIHRCLCNLNYVRKDDACIPGNGSYGDLCDEPEDHEYVLRMLNRTRHRVSRDILEKPGQPSRFDMGNMTKGNPMSYDDYKNLRSNNPKPMDKLRSQPNGSHGREETLAESVSVSTKVKCDPSRYSYTGGQVQNQTSNENETDLFFKEFGKKKIGCNPVFNLQCLQGQCRCANELSFRMFKVAARNKGNRGTCKRNHFYSCAKNEDCANGNCVQFSDAAKLCLPEVMRPNDKFSSAATFHHVVNLYFLLSLQIAAIYVN